MKLRTFQSVDNGEYVFIFSIDPDSISSDDILRIKKFGAPEINFGGVFDDGEELSFELPNQYVDLPAGFPFRQVFSLVAPFDTDGLSKFLLYRTTIQERISDAVAELRGLSDNFTGEYLTTI